MRIREAILAALLLLGSLPSAAAAGKLTAPPGKSGALNLLVTIAVGGVVLLAAALWLAWRAGRPRKKAPPKRSFESGRALAWRSKPRTTREALAALPRAEMGELVDAREIGPEHVEVALVRRRSHPCEEVAGYVAGLFGAAWASDVRVAHPTCGGKDRRSPCVFEVVRVRHAPQDALSPAFGRAAGSSTRG